MPGDLAIAPVSAFGPAQRTASATGTKASDTTGFQDTGSGTQTAATSSPILPNPSMSIDPGLGLVVMEFRNDAGKVTSTIPTQKQLDSYRTARLEDRQTGTGTGTGTGVSAQSSAGQASSQTTGSLVAIAPKAAPTPDAANKTASADPPASQGGTASTLGVNNAPPQRTMF